VADRDRRALIRLALAAVLAALAARSDPAGAVKVKPPPAVKQYSSGTIRAAVPDEETLERSIRVPDSGAVSEVSVYVRLSHPRVSDLTLTLVSPRGTEVVLFRRRGGMGADLGVGKRGCALDNGAVFGDSGEVPLELGDAPFNDYFVPEEPVARLHGEQARGRWTLRVEDGVAGGRGTLHCWGIVVGRDVTAITRTRRGAVRAEVAFRAPYVRRGVRLRIVRRGARRLDAAIPRYFANPVSLLVRDLDGDHEPEVVLDVWTGGAHCCTVSRIYRYEQRRYRVTSHDWGNVFPPYRIVDFGRDGRLELRSADDRFAYVFTAFAGSLFPVQIWRYDRGRMLDVTRRFPGIVARDVDDLHRTYRRWLRDKMDVRGVLAAWMADMALLGREQEGWAALEAARRRGELDTGYGWPSGRKYLRALRAYLLKLGYIRA
jgi:subtilisin-like proprotein convertase family protein